MWAMPWVLSVLSRFETRLGALLDAGRLAAVAPAAVKPMPSRIADRVR